MNQFLEDTWTFNEKGGTPVDDSYDNLSQALDLIKEEVKELEGNLESYKLHEQMNDDSRKNKLKAMILDDLVDINVTSAGLAFRMGLYRTQLEFGQLTVSESNLAKFDKTEEDAKESVKAYENDPRYCNVDYREEDGYYVIYGSKVENPTGYKILKSAKWEDPQKKLNMIMKIK